jgi:hypothetical protein
LDLYNFGGAEMLLENYAKGDTVLEILEKLLTNSEKYKRKLEEYFLPDAERVMADYILTEAVLKNPSSGRPSSL